MKSVESQTNIGYAVQISGAFFAIYGIIAASTWVHAGYKRYNSY